MISADSAGGMSAFTAAGGRASCVSSFATSDVTDAASNGGLPVRHS